MDKVLKNSLTDILTSIAKAGTGVIPIYGSIISEIVSNVIPNQRIDRIATYCAQLNEKLEAIPVERLNELLQRQYVVDLLEEGFVQASRALSDERRNYIISILMNGVSDDDKASIQAKYLLMLLNELNDIEIIWLQSYFLKYSSKYQAFYNEHENILSKLSTFTYSTEEELLQYSVQRSYIDHLERLGLISHAFKYDQTNLPLTDREGKQQIKSSKITILGAQLLKFIGLTDTSDPYEEMHANLYKGRE